MFMESRESIELDGRATLGNRTVEGDELIAEAAAEVGLASTSLLSERSIVKLDKAARMAHLRKLSTIVVSREYNDPLYKKLAMLNKQKAIVMRKIELKYAAKGNARMRQVLAAARSGGMKVQHRDMNNNLPKH
jgi:hypothetical protein